MGTNFVGPGASFVAHLATNVSPTLLNEFTSADHIFLNPSGNHWQRPSTMTISGVFDNGMGGKLPGLSINNGSPMVAASPPTWPAFRGKTPTQPIP